MSEKKGWRERAILPGGWVTTRFFALEVRTLGAAVDHVQALPYGRNESRSHFAVFDEGRGTCSTKHALLKELALEQGWDDVVLVLGMVHLDPSHPVAGPVMQQHGVPLLIDAHCVLDIAGEVIDVTFPDATEPTLPLVEQSPIHPDDIMQDKARRHRAYLTKVAEQQALDADSLWAAREAYIAALTA